uniref:Uncharacterized protein n=1 Tax=Leptobrachium leishanense TaxID=445787 RepID=A0A8C5LKN5_9ANUR
MTSQRLSGYEVTLLSNPTLHIEYSISIVGPSAILNALLGLKGTDDNTPPDHDCLPTIDSDTSPRPDMCTTPFPEADVVFVDGSCTRPTDTIYYAGYAVVSLPNLIHEAEPIPYRSAQAAELIALTRACILYTGMPVTIYTDSKYAFGVVHDHGRIWQKRGYVAADGKPISHLSLVDDLLSALRLPSALAVLHCRAHTRRNDAVSLGSNLADMAAKRAASTGNSHLHLPMLKPPSIANEFLFSELQRYATDTELKDWCYPTLRKNLTAGLITKNGKVCIPQSSATLFIDQFHGASHHSINITKRLLESHFYITDLLALTKDYVSRCLTCLRNHPNNPPCIAHQHLEYPTTPFTHLQIGFTHIPRVAGKAQEYALVMVDMFSRWPEVFPTRAEDAKTVVRILTREIIPRWGIPLQLNSDRGPTFTSRLAKSLYKALQVDWKYHIPWHPQSSGLDERMNRSNKDRLRKATGGTFHNWKSVLPIVLAEIRMSVNRNTGFSPFEILMGRPFPSPWARHQVLTDLGDLQQVRDEYVRQLITSFRIHQRQSYVQISFPPRYSDQILLKHLQKGKRPEDFAYGPPTTIVAITRTAILTEASPTWIHASRAKLVLSKTKPKTKQRGVKPTTAQKRY